MGPSRARVALAVGAVVFCQAFLAPTAGAFTFSVVPVKAPMRPVVAGSVRLCGGPAPGACRVGSITLCEQPGSCATTDRVAAVNSAGRRVAIAKLNRGRFRLILSPGR
jgi:hypothetical protein